MRVPPAPRSTTSAGQCGLFKSSAHAVRISGKINHSGNFQKDQLCQEQDQRPGQTRHQNVPIHGSPRRRHQHRPKFTTARARRREQALNPRPLHHHRSKLARAGPDSKANWMRATSHFLHPTPTIEPGRATESDKAMGFMASDPNLWPSRS